MMRSTVPTGLDHEGWFEALLLFAVNKISGGLAPGSRFLSMANNPLLPPRSVAALRKLVPTVAHRATEALVAEIPEYGPAVRSPQELDLVERAIRVALRGLLGLTEQPVDLAGSAPRLSVVEAAYSFGQYEAKRGRTMDGLLAAYRVGARVAWRDLSAELLRRPVPSETVARIAELVFAYIDRLSAASIAGHADELATAGRAREQRLERLAVALLEGAEEEELLRLAMVAAWAPPPSLVAVLTPETRARSVLQRLDHRTLVVPPDLVPDGPRHHHVLLAPVGDGGRRGLRDALEGATCVLGPTRRWSDVGASYRRARRAAEVVPSSRNEPLDTDEHLVELALHADEETLADLRERALAPLGELRPSAARRLAETLRLWLLHQGRRDEVAAALHVHPQTVRYRMTQLRQLYGERLNAPAEVRELVVALAADPVERPSPRAPAD
jgi:hypothetical protein